MVKSGAPVRGGQGQRPAARAALASLEGPWLQAAVGTTGAVLSDWRSSRRPRASRTDGGRERRGTERDAWCARISGFRAVGSGRAQSCRLGWGRLTASVRESRGAGAEDSARCRSSPQGGGPGPSQRAKEGPEGGQRARRASTARIPSRELEGGTAGRTPGKAARGGGCAGVRRQSTHPVTLKQSVPFLSHSSPHPPVSLPPHWRA